MKKFLKISVAVVFAFAFAKMASATVTVPPTLMQGSHGTQVMNVQTVVGVTADGSFGPMTKAAVIAWQSAHGLTADGVVGPMTAAAMNGTSSTGALCPNGNTVASSCTLPPSGSSSGPTCPNGNLISNNCLPSGTTGGPLAGLSGTIANVNELSAYNNEEVAEGDSDVKVAGFDVKASNDGDIQLVSTKITFAISNSSGSTRLGDYVDSISIWQGSTKIGSADASDFNKDSTGNYSKTISLSNSVVRADKTEKFYISVDAPSSLDSGDLDSETVTIDVENLRYKDGSGVVTTEDGYDLDGMDVGIAFVDFSTAADTNFKISTDTSTPDAGIVIVDDTDTTDGVTLLKGKIKIEGTSDVTLNELPISLTVTGATNIDALTGNVVLTIGGEEFSESTGANCDVTCATNTTATLTFDDLDFDMNAGDTVNFSIKADIEALDGVSFDEGDTLTASLSTINRGLIDAENSEGDQLTSGEKTGTATGQTQEFRTQGISLDLVSVSAVKTANDTNDLDTGTFTIKFKVTAVGDDVYIATTASTGGAINNSYTVYYGSTATLTDVSEAIVNTTDTDVSSGGNWLVEDGSSETLEMTVLRSGSSQDALYRAALASVKWNTDDSSSSYNSYTSNLDSFVTGFVALD